MTQLPVGRIKFSKGIKLVLVACLAIAIPGYPAFSPIQNPGIGSASIPGFWAYKKSAKYIFDWYMKETRSTSICLMKYFVFTRVLAAVCAL